MISHRDKILDSLIGKKVTITFKPFGDFRTGDIIRDYKYTGTLVVNEEWIKYGIGSPYGLVKENATFKFAKSRVKKIEVEAVEKGGRT